MSRRPPLMVRGAATTPLLSLFLVAVIAGLSYLAAAAPTLLADGRTATVQRAVASLPDLAASPSAVVPGLPRPDAAPAAEVGVWGGALKVLERSRLQQPEPLRSLLGEPRMAMTVEPVATLDVDPDRVTPMPRNRVALVSDPGLAGRIDVIEGRMPEITEPGEGIEIVLTSTIAEQLAWPLGSERRWDDSTLTLTGIVTPNGDDEGDWAFIGGSIDPIVEVDANGDRTLIGAGFMHVDQAAVLVDHYNGIKTSAWMPFHASSVDADTAEAASAQLRLLAADPVDVPMYATGFYDRGMSFSSSLPTAIDTGTARAGAMTAVVTVAAVGPITVATVVLALASRLIAVRRITSARVLRARGASIPRLIALLGGEGAVLGTIGVMIGAGLAAVLPGWTHWWILLIPAALGAVPAAALPWGALTDAERRGRHDLGESTVSDRASFRRAGFARAALQALILTVSVVLAFLILARGGTGGADPLLLSLPVLLGAAGSILVLRLLPPLLRIAEIRGARHASLSALLGPARARRDPVVRAAPVLAVVVGTGVAVFSVAFAATVSDGIVRSATISVGADVRVDAAYITESAGESVAAIDGVAAVAALHGDSSADASVGGQKTRTHVYAVDRNGFVAVQRDPETALPLPPALAESTDGPVPVVASEKLLARLGVDATDPGELEISGVPVRVVGTAAPQVPFGAAEQWVIVDPTNADVFGQRGSGLEQLYIAVEPGTDADDVGEAAVEVIGGDAAFQTPSRVAAVYAEDPGFGVVRGALLAGSAIVVMLLGVALIATLLLGAPARARVIALLRTLGHSKRGVRRLVAWEVAPALMLALPFGWGTGVAMAWLMIPQLDLRGFVGGPTQPTVQLGGVWPVAVVIGFAAVTAVAVVVASAFASRLDSAQAIRADDERDG